MDSTKPYAVRYVPYKILEGLKFYYEALDKADITIYLDKNFPIKRSDILLSIDYLSALPHDSPVNNLSHSHPSLQMGMESIEDFSKLNQPDLSKKKIKLLSYLSHFLLSANNIMFKEHVFEIRKALLDLPNNERVIHLIELKHHYSQNEGSFPSGFIKEIAAYCDSEINKIKELINFQNENKNASYVSQNTFGNNTTIMIGDNNNPVISNWIVNAGDFASLKRTLLEAGLLEEDISELSEIIDKDNPSPNTMQFGDKTKTWITKMLRKVLDAKWQIAIGAAGNLLADSIMHYYGWK